MKPFKPISTARHSIALKPGEAALVGTGLCLVQVWRAGGQVLKGRHAGLCFDWAPFLEVLRTELYPGVLRVIGKCRGGTVELLHAGIGRPGYVCVVLQGMDLLDVTPPFHVVPLEGGGHVLCWQPDVPLRCVSDLERQMEARVGQGLQLDSPSARLDRAVAFCQQLLDLSFDGDLMVCDLFRWKDVWARDLATGLLPGALWTGRAAMAVRSLEYDLARYAANDPAALKNQDDTSKGGTIDGVAWTLSSLRQRYLHDGDEHALRRGFSIMRPWVEQWIRRFSGDPVGDLTENYDHVYHELSPEGVKTLGANALWALMVGEAGTIARALGEEDFASECAAGHAEMGQVIDAAFWDEDSGAYANLLWWGERDQRTNSVYHALLGRSGAANGKKFRRALESLAARNHRAAGSLTVWPPLTHVPPDNDQNATIWPWWNLWEAREWFALGERETGLKMLDSAAATVELPEYPGCMKEILSPEGESIGGKAFVTGAGCFLDTVVTGLLGIRIEHPGKIRVQPSVPASWSDWEADLPWHGGRLRLTVQGGVLKTEVDAPGWEVVPGLPESSVLSALSPRRLIPRRPAESGPAAVLQVPGLQEPAWPDGPRVTPDRLPAWLREGKGLIITGSAVPLTLPGGASLPGLLDDYFGRGGHLVLSGVTVSSRRGGTGRGILAEAGGIFDWHEELPVCDWVEGRGHCMAVSPFCRNDPSAAAEDPLASAGGLPAWEEVHALPGAGYLGEAGRWVWYRVEVEIPEGWAGRELMVDLGCVEDFEHLFWNGVRVADWTHLRGSREIALHQERPELWELPRLLPRCHRIPSQHPAVRAGQTNTLMLQIYRTYDGRAWVDPKHFRVGVETGRKQWQPVDERRPGTALSAPFRRGVSYWGLDCFFNSWDTVRGMSGFQVEGTGFFPSEPVKPLLPALPDLPVGEVFTDFSVFRPWRFTPLAFTRVSAHVLHPLRPEPLPCMARLDHETTGALILMAGPSVANLPGWKEMLAASVWAI